MNENLQALSSLLELIPNAAICADADGQVLCCNKAARRFLSGSGYLESVTSLLPTELMESETEICRFSATVKQIPCGVSALRVRNQRVYTFQPETIDARETVPATLQMLALLTKECRKIKSAIEQISQYDEEEILDDTLSYLYHSYYSILRIVGRLELATDILQGKLLLHRQTVDVIELCDRLESSLQFPAKGDGISLAFRTDCAMLFADCDPTLLEFMLLSLLTNSLAHCGDGDSLVLSAKQAGRQVIFSVTDTGSGMDEETMADLFTHFRGARILNNFRDGLGYGLFLTKSLAELHGGRLLVESAEGQGTTVRFTLPLAAPDNSFRATLDYTEQQREVLLAEMSCIWDETNYTAQFMD